jgi:hypothetical protein
VSSVLPTFAEWLALSDGEQVEIQSRWNPYGGEGQELVSDIAADFRAKYGHIPGVEVDGPGVYHGGDWVIAVRHPFIFDRRTLPARHLGITVHTSLPPELPAEFREGTRKHSYVWAPPHYEQFVDRCAEQIRTELRRPDISRDEMLSALVGIPFAQFVELCRGGVREGRMEPFE